jgi:zinc transport system substrate-binding protein
VRAQLLLLTGLSIALLAGASGAAPLRAAASIHPISAIVREIGGDSLEVTTIVPTGADPHHFELTPKTAKAIYDADVVFTIGDDFDGWMLPAGGKDLKDCLIVRLYEDFDDSLLAMGRTFNPHFWLDPLYAKSGFKDFVAFHPAWSYFARRYGLNEHGTLEMSHEQEPSAKHIGEIIREMIRNGVKFIVVEDFSNHDLAESVASQTGARIISLDPLGGDDMPGRVTYAELLNHDVSVIEQTIQGN